MTNTTDTTKDQPAAENVVVRIYEIDADDNGSITTFTVTLSMTEKLAMASPRDSETAIRDAQKRAIKVMKRDGKIGHVVRTEFIRERLVHASRATQPRT